MSQRTSSRCRLYLVTPPAIKSTFSEELKAALGAGDVAALQLRLKEAADDDIKRAAEQLMPITAAHDVAFILNDRPDLAQLVGADGVHIGQEDASYADARAHLGAHRIVGITCHDSRHLAMEAGEMGADYVAFGAFFPTTSKEPKTRADLDLLRWWSEIFEIPCVAIGGITVENCTPLIQAGADFLAVIGGIWNHPQGPAKAIQAFNATIVTASGG